MARCRSCGAVMEWAKTQAGKVMPIDAEPSENGNLVYAQAGVVRFAKPDDPGPRFTSHFATCPDAKQFRRDR